MLSKFANFYWRLRAKYSRYFWSTIRFVPNLTKRYISPWWTVYAEARRVVGYTIKGYVDSRDGRLQMVFLGHRIRPRRDDPAIFLARLANRCAAPEARSVYSLNLFIVGDGNVDLRPYLNLPYLFGKKVNVNFIRDEAEIETFLSTLQSSRLADDLRRDLQESPEDVALTGNVPGLIRLPQIFLNQAREYLKSLSWSAQYCSVSLLDDGDIQAYVEASSELAQSHPTWRFVILGPGALALDLSREQPANTVVPARSGLGFLTQIALATQADAYFGDADSFGISSAIAGLPAMWLSGGDGAASPIQLGGNVSQARQSKFSTADLRTLLDDVRAAKRLIA